MLIQIQISLMYFLLLHTPTMYAGSLPIPTPTTPAFFSVNVIVLALVVSDFKNLFD